MVITTVTSRALTGNDLRIDCCRGVVAFPFLNYYDALVLNPNSDSDKRKTEAYDATTKADVHAYVTDKAAESYSRAVTPVNEANDAFPNRWLEKGHPGLAAALGHIRR